MKLSISISDQEKKFTTQSREMSLQQREIVKLRLEEINSVLQLSSDTINERCEHLLYPTAVPSTINSKIRIANYIDHTILKPTASRQEIEQLCREAIQHNFYAVCVNLSRLNICVQELKDTNVKIAVVVGFPLGTTSTSIKVLETREALEQGAHEIDMVINMGALLESDYQLVFNEVKELVHECNKKNAVLKCIIETSQLPKEEQIIDACLLCLLAGAGFVKTNTGFLGGGADLDHVKLMRLVVGYTMGKVKASGGVRSYADAIKFVQEGHVDRIGTSSGVKIVQEEQEAESEHIRRRETLRTKGLAIGLFTGVFLLWRTL
jgi:deoxyribose-phosphate aldolase